MYTRNYFDGGEGAVPRGYDGVALRDEPCTEPTSRDENLPEKAGAEWDRYDGYDGRDRYDERNGRDRYDGYEGRDRYDGRDGHNKHNGGGFLENILGNLNIRLPSLDKIGFEEILIIAIAAFLFFSADGDRECALILLALLLIN